MGSLWNFGFSDEFVREFPIFVETGYGEGHGIERALQFDFERIYSIEFYDKAAASGRVRWAGEQRVTILPMVSTGGIYALLREYLGVGMFFWLDAHFPGADYCGEAWDAHPLPIRLPLEEELDVIARHGRHYAILADDLNYYAELPYQQRAVIPPQRHVRPLDFLTRFTDTHSVDLRLNDKGYALIVPLGAPMPRMINIER